MSEQPAQASNQTAADDQLKALNDASPVGRMFGYVRLMGPGYLQSAMTLGGGTAFASIFAGAAFGYQLIWVAPLSMLLGIIVLAAVSHQTLSTGKDPFHAMREYAGGFFAYGWAISAVLSSIIWQLAQYALASAMLAALARSAGWDTPDWVMGLIALAWCIVVALLYGSTSKLVRVYENLLKAMVWFIILCFGYVVFKTGIPEPGKLLAGFVPSIPEQNQDVKGITLVVSGLAAAVGVNMLFVYPYSLRKRGWGRAHRRLAHLDLIFGMFVPYAIAASLMLIAAASVFHFGEPDLFEGRGISPVQAASVLADPERLGPVAGLWIFGLGIVAMALSSITMQMVCSGFACSQMFGWKQGSAKYFVGMMLPAIGVLGSVFWSEMRLWVAVPTNVICGLFMPLAYIGFIRLQRNRKYLGDDRPGGLLGNAWTLGMVIATVVLIVFLVKVGISDGPGFIDGIKQKLGS